MTLIAGILAALVILFSQALRQETSNYLSKIKAEQDSQSAESDKDVIIVAPSEAVPSGQSVEVADADPSLIREIVPGEEVSSGAPRILKSFLTDFFKTLFRVYISPQAP
ncbi:MAG TPA: hypothetical protein PLR06_00160 [Cyclobacteriaceae bacterium]|nr:hypothetical protein [Cyclobacteriaceae bacterium]